MMQSHFSKPWIACAFVVVLAGIARAQEVRVGAGAAATENVFKKIQPHIEAEAGLKLVLVDNGPVDAMEQLREGKIDAAVAGLTFPDWVALMDKSGKKLADPSEYKYRVIGKDIVKIITHPDVKVKSLKKEQIKGLLTGTVTNWQEVGGPDVPVVVVLGTKIPGTQSVVQKQVMDNEKYVEKRIDVATASDVKTKVKATPGAIGLAPLSLVDDTVGAPEIPEVGRPMTLATKGAPSADVLKLIDYIAGQGKKYLK